MRNLEVAVNQVEVDMQLGAASRFSFTIAESYSHKFHMFLTGGGDDLLEALKFGTEVEVSMGYVDGESRPIALRGLITEISTSFPEGGSPELTVGGYDHGFPLTIGQHSRTWSKRR